MITITEAIVVILVDADNVDGSNVIRKLHNAESNVIETNWDALAGGNADLVNRSITPTQRRNILATPREESFVDTLIAFASENGAKDLFR